MNKSQLIEIISEKGKTSKREAEQFVNLVTDSMIAAMLKEERIEIRGFGSLTVRKYEAYEGRNPKTGEVVKVEAKRLPFFKAGKDLLDRVNKK